jgi:hypothetical protein
MTATITSGRAEEDALDLAGVGYEQQLHRKLGAYAWFPELFVIGIAAVGALAYAVRNRQRTATPVIALSPALEAAE